MRVPPARRLVAGPASLFICACILSTVAEAQGVAPFPSPSNPTNDCGCRRRGDDPIPVSSGMLTPFLPKIPNLEFGFLYSFGKNVRTGRFTADYTLPYHLRSDSVLFGEAHAEGWDFWKRPGVSITTPAGFTTTTSTANNRVDLSFGGGYRTMLGNNTFVGVNGFYDTSRLYNRWYSSGGVGLEMAATVGGDDAIDLNFNWYGNLFNRDVLVNAFRNKGNSFDLEAGYSHALFDHALDLRLKFAGYQFDVGNPVYGWRGGADLTTKNGMFTLRYEHGNDRLNGQYNTVGGFVNVGFQFENVLRGDSPLIMPEPVFRSPRDLRRLLGLKVKRNWHQNEATLGARCNDNCEPSSDCALLSGSVLLLDNYTDGTTLGASSFSPTMPLPSAKASDFTICWCRLINPYPSQKTIRVTNVYEYVRLGVPVCAWTIFVSEWMLQGARREFIHFISCHRCRVRFQ